MAKKSSTKQAKASAKKKAPKAAAATKAPAAAAPREVSGETQPYNPLLALRQEVDRVFDQYFGGHWPADWRPFHFDPLRPLRSWASDAFPLAPSADMTETPKDFEVTIELPGMSEDDIDISITDTTVTVQGEKKAEKEEKEKDYHVTERTWGRFRRSFGVPAGVDPEHIKGSFSKGVLTITMPKSEEAKSKTRKIKVTSD